VHPKFGTPFFATWVVGIVFGLIAAVVPLNVLASWSTSARWRRSAWSRWP
jgi:amino acid transporter